MREIKSSRLAWLEQERKKKMSSEDNYKLDIYKYSLIYSSFIIIRYAAS